jgi:hypothetical protein
VLSAKAGEVGVRKALFGDLNREKNDVRIEYKTSDI